MSDWEKALYGKLQGFVNRWRGFGGTEQAAAQSFLHHLLDIYDVRFEPGTIFEQHPVFVPPEQAVLFATDRKAKYLRERMDMYLPKICVWEMKGPEEKNLAKHHSQLLKYWALVRTRYMVLCNFHEFWIYDTNDENGQLTPKLLFTLDELPSRGDAFLFFRGEEADLEKRSERVTAEVAAMLGKLLRSKLEGGSCTPDDRPRIIKFILECVFAMFAEDTALSPPHLFTHAVGDAHKTGKMDAIWSLFDDFGRENPADRGNRFVPYVNGALFDRNHPKVVLSAEEISDLYMAARHFDWQGVHPEIFGSIFEQSMFPVERHESGAHFTREADIAKVVGPTIVEPWRRRIRAIRTPKDAEQAIQRMKSFCVLDPACGCGNFLYVAYREMKRLESALVKRWNEVQRASAKRHKDIKPPPVGPYFTLNQVFGIEKNDFAVFLARVVLWIGEHLAMRELGLEEETLPLKNLDAQVKQGDALFSPWERPAGELAIVGNPPYLGVRKLRKELGDAYVDRLFETYPEHRAADYVTYWFAGALSVLKEGERAGYVCTNSIAQNESREASIDKVIAKGGTITDAWRSYPWPGEAAVHIGIVNWVMGTYEGIKTLDGREVVSISPGLREAVDVTKARRLPQNEGLCFMGVTPGNNEFVLTDEQRAEILALDPESDAVIKRFLIGRDVNREVSQKPTRWIIDFGTMSKEEAEGFKGAMRYVKKHVYPLRKENRRESYAKYWWRFAEARPGMREVLQGMKDVLVVPCVSPHLTLVRQSTDICFDHQLMVIALNDDYHFGVLQSCFHEIWAWARGSTLEERLRYTNTTIFETFPFPLVEQGRYNPRARPQTQAANRVAAAARAFGEHRQQICEQEQLGLTKIHNKLKAGELPSLSKVYDELNDAVNEVYGFPKDVFRDDKEILKYLMKLNGQIGEPLNPPQS